MRGTLGLLACFACWAPGCQNLGRAARVSPHCSIPETSQLPRPYQLRIRTPDTRRRTRFARATPASTALPQPFSTTGRTPQHLKIRLRHNRQRIRSPAKHRRPRRRSSPSLPQLSLSQPTSMPHAHHAPRHHTQKALFFRAGPQHAVSEVPVPCPPADAGAIHPSALASLLPVSAREASVL